MPGCNESTFTTSRVASSRPRWTTHSSVTASSPRLRSTGRKEFGFLSNCGERIRKGRKRQVLARGQSALWLPAVSGIYKRRMLPYVDVGATHSLQILTFAMWKFDGSSCAKARMALGFSIAPQTRVSRRCSSPFTICLRLHKRAEPPVDDEFMRAVVRYLQEEGRASPTTVQATYATPSYPCPRLNGHERFRK